MCTQQSYTSSRNLHLPTCFGDILPSSGRRQYKGIRNINTSMSHIYCRCHTVRCTDIWLRTPIYPWNTWVVSRLLITCNHVVCVCWCVEMVSNPHCMSRSASVTVSRRERVVQCFVVCSGMERRRLPRLCTDSNAKYRRAGLQRHHSKQSLRAGSVHSV
jgi:hypothetical protein